MCALVAKIVGIIAYNSSPSIGSRPHRLLCEVETILRIGLTTIQRNKRIQSTDLLSLVRKKLLRDGMHPEKPTLGGGSHCGERIAEWSSDYFQQASVGHPLHLNG